MLIGEGCICMCFAQMCFIWNKNNTLQKLFVAQEMLIDKSVEKMSSFANYA